MAIVYLVIKGGLGNQLFQAALGLYLEQAEGVQVRYLTHGFAGDDYRRHFLLDQFPALRDKVSPPSEAAGAPHYREPAGGQPADAVLADVIQILRHGPGRVILEGYWQNEAYFQAARAAIGACFTPHLQEEAILLGQNLAREGCIGMHVRRSDYGHHGLARTDFYRRAILDIRQAAGLLPVLVFTDEYNFCRFEFAGIAELSIVRGDLQNPLIDFHLLRSCRHYVLSNSSFSWWAAWLGESQESIVFAPEPWCLFDSNTRPVPGRWHAIPDAVQRQ